jgi:hypothetical protein
MGWKYKYVSDKHVQLQERTVLSYIVGWIIPLQNNTQTDIL